MRLARVAPFDFDRAWEFPVSPEAFWATIAATDEYPLWWGWLRSFESPGVIAGSETEFVVQGALPYQLHFIVAVDHVVEHETIETHVRGDLEGPASLHVTPDHDGACVARLTWSLEPKEPFLRRLAVISHPLLAWSHDQVVSMGVRQFRRRLTRAAD
jgi:hypothetical protein